MALIEYCIENVPERPGDVLRVPIPDLAHRVLEIYWLQVRPSSRLHLSAKVSNCCHLCRCLTPFRISLHGPCGCADPCLGFQRRMPDSWPANCRQQPGHLTKWCRPTSTGSKHARANDPRANDWSTESDQPGVLTRALSIIR